MKSEKVIRATKFVILIGVISLFSDMTYEAARSINGPFLLTLGASGTTLGLVAGLGELLGYGLRFISGYITDRSKKYWPILIIGYFLNLFSVPLLAFAGYWQVAVVLMITERIGKAIRTPARDAMLSFGSTQMGRGWGFGLHEAMDQVGATIGPLLVSSALFFRNHDYQLAFGILTIPALIALIVLFYCRFLFPKPEHLEIKTTAAISKGFPSRFWVYIVAVVFIAAGYVDFPLIAYHFKSAAIMKDPLIPVFYSIAMASDAFAALIMGKLYDKIGVKVLLAAVLVSLCFAPMVFLGNFYFALFGMVLWGIGMGAQESIMKAEIAEIIPAERRGTAYGTLNTFYGLFWFAGSAAMGLLYDHSLNGLVIFSVATQLIAVAVLFYIVRKKKNIK